MIKKISEIVLNDNRRKVDAAKVKELAESIKQLGLINPITINSNNVLIAGNHRLEAFKLLGKDEIEVSVLDLNNLLAELAEIDENLVRNELHWTDADKQIARRKIIYLELYPETKTGGDRKSDKIKIQTLDSDNKTFVQDTADKTNKSKSSISQSVKRGIEITEEEAEVLKTIDAPKSYGDILIKQTTETRAKVIDALKVESKPVEIIIQEIKKEEKKVEIEKRREEIKENLVLHELKPTDKKYRIIYADPPWQYGNAMPEYVTEPQDYYSLMSTSDICEMPVKEITEENAVLFIWSTSPHLPEALEVVKSWGFKYKTTFIWDKIKHNMGHYNSVRHEILLVCTKGSCTPDVKKLFDSVVSIERTVHSKKPDEFRNIIDTLYTYGNKIELFARESIKGWDVFGNQIN
jgi:N6-adenosine-specific RNA methylase IME4